MLMKGALAENVEDFSNIATGAAGSAGASATRQEHIPVPEDYESALMAGVRMAQAFLQEEAETGERGRELLGE